MVTDLEIRSLIKKYIGESGSDQGRDPDDRLASFDYCYNYFHIFYKEKRISELGSEKNLQMSCLQLGFYLASWGMLRGSANLLKRSVRHFRRLIFEVSKMSPELWEIDVDKYDRDNIRTLLNCKNQTITALRSKDSYRDPSDTLTTKVMLGVFGNVLAFDSNVVKSFGYGATEANLLKVRRFYDEHKLVFDDIHIPTLDFLSGKRTDLYYPKVKLIDMYAWAKANPLLSAT